MQLEEQKKSGWVWRHINPYRLWAVFRQGRDWRRNDSATGIRFCKSLSRYMCHGIVTPRCGEASQHLSGIITSGVYEFHIICMNTLTTTITFESCLQLRVTDYSSHHFIENLNIECYVNFILRHIVNDITEEEKCFQTSRNYTSQYWSVVASTEITKFSGEHGTPMNQWHQPSTLPIFISVSFLLFGFT